MNLERNGVGEGGVKLSQGQHFPRGKKWYGGGGHRDNTFPRGKK